MSIFKSFSGTLTELTQKLALAEVHQVVVNTDQKQINQWFFGKKEVNGIPSSVLAYQASAYKILKKKAGEWIHTPGLLFPSTKNIEQSSSWQTAEIKLNILKELGAKSVVDLSGGFGIDALQWAGKLEVHHNEQNPELAAIVAENVKTLDANVTTSCMSAEKWLEQNETNGKWLYLDPSRRDEAGKKVSAIEDCTPSADEISQQYLSKCEGILIKLSPMLDHHYLMNLWRGKLVKIVAISVNNEVKELVAVLKPGMHEEIEKRVVSWNNGGILEFSEGLDIAPAQIDGFDAGFLIDPDPGLRKMDLVKNYATWNGFQIMGGNGFLYTEKNPGKTMGKVFRVNQKMPFSSKTLKQFSKKKYSVISRGFFMKAHELEVKLKLKPHDENFLLFTGNKQKAWMIEGERIF